MNALQQAHQRLFRLAQTFREANPGGTSSNDYFYWRLDPEKLDDNTRFFNVAFVSGSWGITFGIEQGEGGELVVDPSSHLDAGPYDRRASRGNYTKALTHLHAAMWTTLGHTAHPDAIGLLAPSVRADVRVLGKKLLQEDPSPATLDSFWSNSIPSGNYQPNPAYEILKDLIFGRNGINPPSFEVLGRYYLSIKTTWNQASKRFTLIITFSTENRRRFEIEIQGKHREPINPNLRIQCDGSDHREYSLDMKQLEDFLSDEDNIAHKPKWFESEEAFYLWLFDGKEGQRQYHSMIHFGDETDQIASRFLVCANRTKKCLHISRVFPGFDPNDTTPKVYAVEQPNPEAVSRGWKYQERTASRERFLVKTETNGGKKRKTQIPTWIGIRPDLWTPAGLRYLLDPQIENLAGNSTESVIQARGHWSPILDDSAPALTPQGRALKAKVNQMIEDSDEMTRYEVMGERGKYFSQPSDENQVLQAEAMARVRALRRLIRLETRYTATPPNVRGPYTSVAWTGKGRVTLSEREPLSNRVVDPYDFGLDWHIEWVKHHKAEPPQTSLKLCIKGYGFDDEVSARVAEMEAGSVHTKPHARVIPCFIIGPRQSQGELGSVLCSFTPLDPANQGGVSSDEPFSHKAAAAKDHYQSACRAAAALAFVFDASIEALLWPNLAQRQIYGLYLDAGSRQSDAGDQPPHKDYRQELSARSAKGRNFILAYQRAIETAQVWLDWLRSWHGVDYAPLPSYGAVAPFGRTSHGEDHDNAQRALEAQSLLLSALTKDERPRAALERLALDVLTVLDKYPYPISQKRVRDARIDQALYNLRGER